MPLLTALLDRTLLLDNPILIKHARSRLRRQHLLPSIVGVVVLAICILWAAVAANQTANGGAFIWLLLLQGAILFLGGTSQVATVVAHAKDSWILDFHRISPLTPVSLTLGFLLGGAVREWVLFACTLPFSLICVMMGSPHPLAWAAILLDTVVVALLYHAAAVAAGLVATRPRNVNSGVVALVFMLHWFFVGPGPGLLTIIPTVREGLDLGRMGLPRPTFFGAHLPEFLLSLLHQIPLFVFLFIAAERKMRHERAYFYPKPLAVLFYGVIALLILGDVVNASFFGRQVGENTAVLWVVYTLTLAGLLLSIAVTPGAGDFANGVRRARKRGLERAPLWSDLSANWAPVVAFCAILAAATFAAAALLERGRGWAAQSIAAAVVGACVVLYFGSAKQAFDLMFRKNSQPFFMLLLFLLWIVPLIVGLLASLSRFGEAVSQTLMSLSPIAGIALIGSSPAGSGLSTGGRAALSTSLVLSIAFVQLRLRAERRATEAAVKVRE